jgi:pyruvate formate lyase activating enzyme
MKQPSMVDFPGHLAAVFFTSGCNLRCGFCHNPELVLRRAGLSWVRLEEACMRFCADWVTGAVISGGEPTLAPDLPGLIRFLRKYGWAVKLDTNGSNPGVLRECLPLVDYVAMDVKTAPSAYRDLTGCADTDAIRESMALIKAEARDYEFRTTVIEAHHDNARIEEIRAWVSGARRYVLQPFVPRDDHLDPAFRAHPRTSPARMRAVSDFFAQHVGEVVARG